MLTINDLFALLMALDLGHVQRLILVGRSEPAAADRRRPSLCRSGRTSGGAEDGRRLALARLTVELRTAAGSPSDSLKLASWYTREPQPVDADRVLSDLELSNPFNDLTIRFWETRRRPAPDAAGRVQETSRR